MFELQIGIGQDRLATRNLNQGISVYGEDIVRYKKDEYRIWDPYRSKLAAAIVRGLSHLPIEPSTRVLYLGAASGTTVSHVSDIVGNSGRIYAIEFAQRSFRDLVSNVSTNRSNITPILADARFPQKYRSMISQIECVYCDIAQPDQTRILIENMNMFLNESGEYLYAVKARSIDVGRNPIEIFKSESKNLQDANYEVQQIIRLDPFELDHVMIQGKRDKT